VLDADVVEERARSLRDLLHVVRRHWRLAGAWFGITLALALLATLLMPRRYTASTRLQVSRQSPIQLRLQSNVIGVDDGDRSEGASRSFLSTQVAALRSRDLADRVIRRNGLADDPAFLDPARHATRTPALVPATLRPRGFDAAATRSPIRAGGERAVDPDLLDRYLGWLSVRDLPGTSVVEIAFTTPSPTLSASLAAAHARAYVEANADVLRATDAVARGFLGRKIKEARRRVRRAEGALDRFATRHPSIAVDQEHRVEGQRLAELSSLLTKAETTRVSLESRYEFLAGGRADPLVYFLDRPGVQKLRLALLEARAQRAGLDGRLGTNHPRMIELRRLERELANQLRLEVSRGVAAVRSHYDAAREREERLRRKLEQQQRLGTEMSRLGARYELLKNEITTARALHTSLLEQQMATAVNSDLTPTNVRVMERPEVPTRPSRPKVPLSLALGLVGATVVGLGAAFLRDYFDDSFKSPTEVEALLPVRTLGAIPSFGLVRRLAGEDGSDADGGRRPWERWRRRRVADEVVVLHDPSSRVAEAFRTLRTALLFSGPAQPRVIVVTSARPGEGKTVATLNLATSLAQSGARVVLVEADLRHPRCHRVLRVGNARGLSTYLAGETDDLAAVIRRIAPEGLFFLPAGPPRRHPADLLGSRRMVAGLRELAEGFDFVVVDTPPALPVTDPVVLGRMADGVVLVVKGNATPRQLVHRVHERLVQAGAQLLGVIVNDVPRAWAEPYFGGPYYGASADGGDGEGPLAPGMRGRIVHALQRHGERLLSVAWQPWLRVVRLGRGGRPGC
jgi:capsular exopolysaccharide synthesis family protein